MTSPTILNAHRESKKTGKTVKYSPNITVEFPNIPKGPEDLFKDVEDFSFGPLQDTTVSVDPAQKEKIELSPDELKFMTTQKGTPQDAQDPKDPKVSNQSNITVSEKDVEQFTEGEPGIVGQAWDATTEFFSPKHALAYLERPYYGAERAVGIPSEGLVRGAAGLAWFGDMALTYTAGTLENLARAGAGSFGFGEGWVDYDNTWFGKNAFGVANEKLGDLVRYMNDNLDIKDKAVAEKVAMYIPEFMVSISPATFVKATAQVGKETLGYIGGIGRLFSGIVPDIMKADKLQKTVAVNAARSKPVTVVSTVREEAALEAKLAPQYEKLAVAKGGQKIASLGGAATPNATYNIARIEAKINGEKAKLSSELIKKIKIGSKGRLKINKTGDKWYNYSLSVPRRDEVVTLGTKKYVGRDPATNLPIYRDKVFIKKFPDDPTDFKKMYHQLQYFEVASGISVAIASTEHLLKGTGLENYKFLAGFLGAFTTPSATASFAQKLFDGVFSRAQTLRVPVGGMLGKVPGTDKDMTLSMPSLLMFGAIMAAKAGEAARGTGRDTESIVRSIVDSEEFYDKPFIQRLVASSAGIPFYRAMLPRTIFARKGKPESGFDIGGLDNVKPLRDSKGEILYRTNAAGKKVPQTELSAALALRDQNVKALARFSDLMEDQMDPSDLDKIKKLYSESGKLHDRLNKMNATNGFELFNAAIEQINLAIINQNMAGMFSRAITDTGYRKRLFAGSNIGNSFETGAIYNMMLTQTKEIDTNLNFVKEALTELTGTYPQLQKEFESLFANMKEVSNKINRQKEDLAEYAEKFAKDTRNALSLDDKILMSDIQHLAKGDGNGLGIKEKFGSSRKERADNKHQHAESFMGVLKEGRAKLNDAKDDAYNEVKNNPSSATAKKLENNIPATEFINRLEQSDKLRKIKVSTNPEQGIDLETVISGWKEYGGIQDPRDFVGSIKAYSKWKTLQNEGYAGLEDRMKELASLQMKGELSVALPQARFKLGEVNKTIAYTTDDFGGIDLARTLQDIDEHAENIVRGDLQLSKSIYLRRLLTLLKSNDSPETGLLGSKEVLDSQVPPSVLQIKDMVALESRLSSYIHNNKFTEKGVNLIPSKKEIEEILNKYGIVESKIASELNVLLKESYDSKTMEVLTTPYGQGKHTKTPFELFDSLITKPADEIIPVLEKMSSTFKDIKGVKQNVNKGVKKKIQEHLDDQIGLNLVENPRMIINNFENITKLREKGYVSEQTYRVASVLVKRMEDNRIERDLLKNFDEVSKSFISRVQKLVKQVDDAEKRSILKDLENVKDLGKVYDYLLASRVNISSKPKIDVDSTKNFDRIDADQEEMLKTANELTKRRNVEDIITKNPDISVTSKEFRDILDQLSPKHIQELQSTRIDTLLETVFGIKPGSTAANITQSQKDNLEGLLKLMIATASERAIKVTETRQSAFGPSAEYKVKGSRIGLEAISPSVQKMPFTQGAKLERAFRQEVNDSFFGLSTDIDIKQFGESMVELSPLFDRVFQYTGKTKLEENLNDLFKAAVLLKAEGRNVRNAMAKLGSLNYKLTAPAALSRIYAGMRGVVSWRYLASEQLIREHQANKARLLASIFTDPTFAKNLSNFLEGQKLSREQSEQIRKHIVTMTGGRLVYYNEEEGKILYDDKISDSQLLQGFTRGVAEYLYKKTDFLRTDDSYPEYYARPEVPKKRLSKGMTAEELF